MSPSASLTYGFMWIALVAFIIHGRLNKRWSGRLASGSVWLSWVLLTISLVQRALSAGHWPLTNRYEAALCFTWAILTIYLLLEVSQRDRQAGPYVLGVALIVATYAVTRPAIDQAIGPLLPALRSMWLQVHVVSTLVAYGAFGVAAGLAWMQLRQPSPTDEAVTVGGRSAWIEQAMERAVALGFPWLTLGILAGAIWAQLAWGRYWGWDPKETWALVTWLWFLMILHVRALRNWRGRRLAGLIMAGFGVVLFTFIGVPWLVRTVRLQSLHGF